jgi:FSR family fosmidomycin resistance protein-like MFS transporter
VLLTVGLTAVGIIAVLSLPLAGAIALMPLLGIGLNGTSSVLYGTVPELVSPARRTPCLRHLLYGCDRCLRGHAPAHWGPRRRFRRPHPMVLIAVAVLMTVPLSALLLPMLPAAARG